MGDYVVIYFDGCVNFKDFEVICSVLVDDFSVVFVVKWWKCGWGEWLLVGVILEVVCVVVDLFLLVMYFYMLLGDCMLIKLVEYVYVFLDVEDCDYIENFDFFELDWIKIGFKEEWLIYCYWFNECM